MTHLCERLVTAARYLENNGVSSKQLSLIHHFYLNQRMTTYSSIYKYFGINKNLQSRNTAFANRILYIAESYQQGKGNFTRLVHQALEKWPLE